MAKIEQLLIIGCGNMGGAMLAGWLASGVDPARFAILDPALKSAPDGVVLHHELSDAQSAGTHDAVMLGFKPQQLGNLAPGLQELIGPKTSIYSLLAGLTLAQLQKAFPIADAYVRVMPNLASRINKSPVVLLESGLSSEERDETHAFFDLLGTAVWLADESKFDLVTALAGSGPGFVYRFIDALTKASTILGLDAQQAAGLALATVDGAASLAASSEFTPEELAHRVASPGGMTREGMDVLDADNALIELLTRTLAATRDRGAALSAGGH